jgi:hypothetical protein
MLHLYLTSLAHSLLVARGTFHSLACLQLRGRKRKNDDCPKYEKNRVTTRIAKRIISSWLPWHPFEIQGCHVFKSLSPRIYIRIASRSALTYATPWRSIKIGMCHITQGCIDLGLLFTGFPEYYIQTFGRIPWTRISSSLYLHMTTQKQENTVLR